MILLCMTNSVSSIVVLTHNDPTLPDKLNIFYSRFDRNNSTPAQHPYLDPHLSPPFMVKDAEVKRLLQGQNSRKAPGPDNVSPATLKVCADQLAPVLTHLFNVSLHQSKVPQCFKTSIIVPVPKKTHISRLNDYRPVALTSVITKVFERLVLQYLKSVTDTQLDMHQFCIPCK
eukprot:TRINITY_DN12164_c1_g2_i4.p1 TRINITY_DN12164_c1_g2~~TRINITY_DN12164_c1_g2_i4.p1  ORF type:complete len:173 (-),score=23.14 TRINITY_DN12164_c1_g2_i4:519-1037(-)